MTTSSRNAVARVEALCEAGLPAQPLIERLAEELKRAVRTDGFFIAATDPYTLLGLGAGIVHDMPGTVCQPFWSLEFEVPDYNKFADLAEGPQQVADLHAATGGRPQRSARWRELRTHMDADAELRAAFTAGGRTWGVLHATRSGGVGGFAPDEVAFVEAIAPHVGRGLRAALVAHPATNPVLRGPGMALLDAEQRLVSATAEALAWFEEMISVQRQPAPLLGTDVPSEAYIVAQEARSRALDPSAPATAVRTRSCTRTGTWLLLHASCLRDADGGVEGTALVVEPAKASEVAPLIVEAYALTPREVDVTQALARGLSTSEIAARLHLSRYTVQDHLKAVYEKVGVSSRGELVARMFADHYNDNLHYALHGAAAA
ncbi:MAG: helix-turn-helix transcriptional regulator [Solirubrobacterales bacterium]|nr:helix-turn-helix transcriptional regulator [Solirubrobacterales bacterium]